MYIHLGVHAFAYGLEGLAVQPPTGVCLQRLSLKSLLCIDVDQHKLHQPNQLNIATQKTSSSYEVKRLRYVGSVQHLDLYPSFVVHLEGVDGRSQALVLHSRMVWALREDLVAMREVGGDYVFWQDVYQKPVWQDDVILGHVVDIQHFGASNVLTILHPLQNRFLELPFVKDYFAPLKRDEKTETKEGFLKCLKKAADLEDLWQNS